MSLKNDVVAWQRAVQLYREREYAEAMDTFSQLTDNVGSKIYFNIGMIYAAIGRYNDAIISFSNAIHLDKFFAVAYFQRGVYQWTLQDYHNASQSFSTALNLMRGNQMVDYRQLGLNYQLFAFEILFNRCICNLSLGRFQDALDDLQQSTSCQQLDEHRAFKYSRQAVEQAVVDKRFMEEYAPFCVPPDLLYEPSEYKVKSTERVDYLGQSKIIASIDERDNHLMQCSNNSHDTDRPRSRNNNKPAIDATMKRMTWTKSAIVDDKRISSATRLKSPVITPLLRVNTSGSSTSFTEKELPPPPATFDYCLLRKDFDDKKSLERSASSPLMLHRHVVLSGTDSLDANNSNSPLSLQANNNSNSVSPFTPSSPFCQSPSNSTSRIKVKIHYANRNETRAILVDSNQLSYQKLFTSICTKFQLDANASNINIRYRDEDGEMVSIGDDDDLEIAITSTVSAAIRKLELFLSTQ